MIAETKNDRIFLIINKAILITITILVAYPLYFVVIASISNYIAINNGNVILWPVNISFDSYLYVIRYESIWTGYKNTILITLLKDLI